MSPAFQFKRRDFLLGLTAFSGSLVTSQLPIRPSWARTSLTGAGASFPAPLYQRWFSEYNKVNPQIQVSYQSVGSGAGVEQFTQGTVDFGASDVAMTDDEMTKVSQGTVLLPMTAGSIVIAYNMPGLNLQLSRQQLIDVFLGKITNWSQLGGPNQAITVVVRSDGSGTTGVFTKHLSAISPEWQSKVGEGKTVEWPVGIGAKGNEGIAAQVLQTTGALGYLEYGYAKQLGITTAKLQNQAGSYVEPSLESASNALSQVELPDNLRAFVSDPVGANSYPIVTYTWILAYQQYADAQKAATLKNVLKWCLRGGQQFSGELGYIPLPDNVVARVTQAVDSIR